MMARFCQFAIAASRMAVEDAKLAGQKLTRAGLCHGTSAQGIGDLGETAYRDFQAKGWRSVEPSVGLEYSAHAATGHLQAELETSGPTTTIASACCTGIDTIAWGVDQIRAGGVKVALVGASEAPISEFIFSLFLAGGFLSTWGGPPSKASRPYDLFRSGLVLSEGAASLVLEELDHALDRGAPIYAEVLGYASRSEGNSRQRQDRYATSLEQTIREALQASHLGPLDIDYICAHANSTKFDDQAEAAAHRAALGSYAYRIPVSSIKSMLGQPFAASGVMQAIATVLAVQNELLPPTINYEVPDPNCDLDYVPNRARVARVRHALFHAHSLGGYLPGSHSAMVVGRLR
jgi:3-oxoacyl-[acyl-carrier-protein] synthase II